MNSGKYTSASNVWQVGLLMWSLKRNERYPHWCDMKCFKSKLSERLYQAGMTCGTNDDELEEDPNSSITKYSDTLRALINECLLARPSDRPPAAELFQRTMDGLVSIYVTYTFLSAELVKSLCCALSYFFE